MEDSRTARRLALADLTDPSKPHDELGFEQLRQAYAFKTTSDRSRVFTRLLVDECADRGRPTVLDIGCGRGIQRNIDLQWIIREHAGAYWGVEPDDTVTPQSGLFDWYENALMEDAIVPQESVDLAFSFMVMEHVADPVGFLNAVHRCLKPGGAYWFVTVNGHHYFTRIAKLLNRLHLDELTLRFVKRKEAVEAYHYPVCYRCNTPRQLERLAQQTGFDSPEFAFVESRGPVGYLPGPLRPLLHAMNFKRRVLHNPRCLLNLFCRLSKPASGAADQSAL